MNWDETQAQFYDKDSWIVLRRKEDKKQIGEGILNLSKYANISLGKKAQDRLPITGCEYDSDAYFEIAVTAEEGLEEDPDKKKRPNPRSSKGGKGQNRNLSAAQMSARSRQSVMEPILEDEEESDGKKKARRSEAKRKSRGNRSTTREGNISKSIDIVLYDEKIEDKETRELNE